MREYLITDNCSNNIDSIGVRAYPAGRALLAAVRISAEASMAQLAELSVVGTTRTV